MSTSVVSAALPHDRASDTVASLRPLLLFSICSLHKFLRCTRAMANDVVEHLFED